MLNFLKKKYNTTKNKVLRETIKRMDQTQPKLTKIEYIGATESNSVIVPKTEKEVYQELTSAGWQLTFDDGADLINPTNKNIKLKISRVKDLAALLRSQMTQMSIVSVSG